MARNPTRPAPEPPIVLVTANSSWNIVNFRMPLLKALVDAGYRPVIAAPADRYSRQLVDQGFEFHDLPINRSGMNPVADGLLVVRYLRLLRATGAGAVLSFTIKPNIYGSIAARIAGAAPVPNVSGLGTAFIGRPWLEDLAVRLYRLAFRRSKVVFFQNDEDFALFLERKIVAREQARRVPGSGVDLERFRPEPGDGEGPVTFLFIGCLLRDNGIREFAEAARLLRQKLPDSRFQILGELDAGNRTAVQPEELQCWVDSKQIEYLGHADDVRPFIRQATAVVLPSYREGLPRALLEAAAMGKPLVAADAPGSRDVVIDGITGILCTARRADSLAKAMERIALMPRAERQLLADAARARVEERFSEKVVIRTYLDALEDILWNGAR
jgi:glycosyltransferase involved in cell wall biosynthesis